jgi:single-strand DNA-binding protein
MPGHARAILVGHAGSDPETRAVGQSQVVSFRLGVSTGWGDKKTTSWWSVSCWGKTGEAVARILRKGAPVLVDGEPTIRLYEHNGQQRTSADLRADCVTFLGGRQDAPSSHAPGDEEIPF